MSNKSEIMVVLQEIFRENFEDDSLIITPETSAFDIDDWDSFEQINLVVSIEEHFNIKFNIQEVSKLKNVGDMANLIYEKEA